MRLEINLKAKTAYDEAKATKPLNAPVKITLATHGQATYQVYSDRVNSTPDGIYTEIFPSIHDGKPIYKFYFNDNHELIAEHVGYQA